MHQSSFFRKPYLGIELGVIENPESSMRKRLRDKHHGFVRFGLACGCGVVGGVVPAGRIRRRYTYRRISNAIKLHVALLTEAGVDSRQLICDIALQTRYLSDS